MVSVEYKIFNEYDSHRRDGTIGVLRRVNAHGTVGPWERIKAGPRRYSFDSEAEAREAIAASIKADRAAATRLGLNFTTPAIMKASG